MNYTPLLGFLLIWAATPALAILGEGPDPDPAHIAERDTGFLLFTRKNPTIGQRIKVNDLVSLNSSNFNASLPTRVVIHGWLLAPYSGVMTIIRRAFLEKDDFNVVIVDWARGAAGGYDIVQKRLPFVGRVVARFLEFLHEEGGLEFSDLTLTGYSFGAHISGFAGKHLKGGRIPVIIALDAAYPKFETSTKDERLDASDADYVGVIHTNTGDWGLIHPVGHADFYPNFGYSQVSCPGLCGHERSCYYFAESILSKTGFWGTPCETHMNFKNGNCPGTHQPPALMAGEPVQTNSTGVYYVPVKGVTPFAMGLIPGL